LETKLTLEPDPDPNLQIILDPAGSRIHNTDQEKNLRWLSKISDASSILNNINGTIAL
jgi:hypothetical protein